MKLNFERVPEFNGTAPHLAEYLRKWLIDWADRNDYNIYADGLVVRTTIDSRLQEMANRRGGAPGQGAAGGGGRGMEPQRPDRAGQRHRRLRRARRRRAALRILLEQQPEAGATPGSATPRSSRPPREEGRSEEEALKALQEDAGFMADLRRQQDACCRPASWRWTR